MAVEVKRANREIRGTGAITFDVSGADVGKTYDFGAVAEGFRITNVNVTVDEAFANADNKISVGLESDLVKFVPQTLVNAVGGIAGGNAHYKAPATTPLIIDIVGSASATGKATVTVEYLKLANVRQEY